MNASLSKIRFAAIGLNHDHIYGQVRILINAGAELVSFYAVEPDLCAEFARNYPQAKQARGEEEILEDESIQLIVSAAIPCDRAPLGVRVMRHGKDYMMDKGGPTTFEQLQEVRRVHSETKRIFSVFFGEYLGSPCTQQAGELIRQGAIGKVVQTIGLGPHRLRPETRPPWFYQREKYGGILIDIGAHQFAQFLYLTRSEKAHILFAEAGNRNHPQYPELDDFGDAIVQGEESSGYLRVDWFTPAGLNSYGDVRCTILGTEGYIELRKTCDLAGRPAGNHLFLVNQKEIKYMDCKNVPLTYAACLLDDVRNRTETAMTHKHCFLACELALQAQAMAMKK
jgi:predicted dehydrogenase